MELQVTAWPGVTAALSGAVAASVAVLQNSVGDRYHQTRAGRGAPRGHPRVTHGMLTLEQRQGARARRRAAVPDGAGPGGRGGRVGEAAAGRRGGRAAPGDAA